MAGKEDKWGKNKEEEIRKDNKEEKIQCSCTMRQKFYANREAFLR